MDHTRSQLERQAAERVSERVAPLAQELPIVPDRPAACSREAAPAETVPREADLTRPGSQSVQMTQFGQPNRHPRTAVDPPPTPPERHPPDRQRAPADPHPAPEPPEAQPLPATAPRQPHASRPATNPRDDRSGPPPVLRACGTSRSRPDGSARIRSGPGRQPGMRSSARSARSIHPTAPAQWPRPSGLGRHPPHPRCRPYRVGEATIRTDGRSSASETSVLRASEAKPCLPGPEQPTTVSGSLGLRTA